MFGCWKYKDNRRTSSNVKHPLPIKEAGGEITNTNEYFKIDDDGFAVFRTSNFDKKAAFTMQTGSTVYGALYARSGGTSRIKLEAFQGGNVRIEADGESYAQYAN